MVKVKLNNIYNSYVKGNLLMLITKFGYVNMLCFFALFGLSVALYLENGTTWCFIVFGSVFFGFIVFSLLHILILPISFKKNKYYANVNNVILTLEEDEGMTFEGYHDKTLLRTIKVYWDDIEKIVYRKNGVEILLPGEVFYINEDIEFLEGTNYMLTNMLKRNVDRHIFKRHPRKSNK